MNKFDKLASEIIAGYNDLTTEQKNLVDESGSNDTINYESFTNAELANWNDVSYKNIQTLKIAGNEFSPVRNIKDRKIFLLMHPGSLYDCTLETSRWFSFVADYYVLSKTFAEALNPLTTNKLKLFVPHIILSELDDLIKKVPNLVEEKALSAAKLNKKYYDMEEFLEYLKS